MRILGISPLDKDATVSLFEDGRVVFACGEERLSRTKLQAGFPHRALQLALKWSGWTIDSIDKVAYAFFEASEEAKLIRQSLAMDRDYQSACGYAELCSERRALFAKESDLDKALPIPGIAERAAEFYPKKPWYKRLNYWMATCFPSGEKRTHQR